MSCPTRVLPVAPRNRRRRRNRKRWQPWLSALTRRAARSRQRLSRPRTPERSGSGTRLGTTESPLPATSSRRVFFGASPNCGNPMPRPARARPGARARSGASSGSIARDGSRQPVNTRPAGREPRAVATTRLNAPAPRASPAPPPAVPCAEDPGFRQAPAAVQCAEDPGFRQAPPAVQCAENPGFRQAPAAVPCEEARFFFPMPQSVPGSGQGAARGVLTAARHHHCARQAAACMAFTTPGRGERGAPPGPSASTIAGTAPAGGPRRHTNGGLRTPRSWRGTASRRTTTCLSASPAAPRCVPRWADGSRTAP